VNAFPRDAGLENRGLDCVHERAGTTDVEVRRAGAGDERFDHRGRHHAAVIVDVVHHHQTVGVLVGQPGQRFGEDHRIATAVGVEQPNSPRRTDQCGAHQRHDRSDPAATRERHDLVGGVAQTEPSLRRCGVNLDALGDRVVEPVRHQAARVPLDSDLQVVLERCRRHRITTAEVLTVHGHAQRQELTGLIAIPSRAALRHVQHKRNGVRRLAYDSLDAQRREAVGSTVVSHRPQYIKYLSLISST